MPPSKPPQDEPTQVNPAPDIPPENLLEITTYPHKFQNPDSGCFEMAVFKQLQGRHKERCLCYRCKKFTPENPHTNCNIARLLFAVCVQCSIVTPVAECKAGLFEERDKPHPWIGG